MAPKSKAPEQASEISSIGKAWLVIYNLLCIFGWLYIDSIFYTHYQDTGHFYGSSLWSRLDAPLKIVQTAALLEVFHAIFKLVKANPVMAFIQGKSRGKSEKRSLPCINPSLPHPHKLLKTLKYSVLSLSCFMAGDIRV